MKEEYIMGESKETIESQEETVDVAEEAVEEVQEERKSEKQETSEHDASVPEENTKEEGQDEAVITGDEPLDEEAHEEIGKLKKHDAALLLVKKTRHMVEDTEKQLDACKLLLEEDLKGYNDAKASLKSNALNQSEQLLEELGYGKEKEESLEEDEVVFEPKEEVSPFEVKEVSGGKFSAFFLALIAAFATFTGLVYLATEKVGVTLDVTKVPDYDTATNVLGWYATLFGSKPDLFLGGAFVVLITAFVFGVVYGIKVATRAKHNLAFAKSQLEEAREYAKHKGDCKAEMDKVDAHMNDAIKVLKTYEVVLNEQNGKLNRILHIEGVKEDVTEYHDKSLREMQDTDMLLKAIKTFISTPMSEEGRLSGKSTMFLHSAKSKLQKFLERLY